jgi:type IV pilus assembly protein PilE
MPITTMPHETLSEMPESRGLKINMQRISIRTIQHAATKSKGFSLIEMMIVVVVIAILVAIAVPMYQSQIQKSRRTSAKTALLDIASREEKFYSTNNYYTLEMANLGYAASQINNNELQAPGGGSDYYTIEFPASASTQAPSYTVQAIPVPGSQQATDLCGTYQLTDLGVQTNTGGAQTTGCW